MNRDIELAYLGIEVPDPAALDSFFGNVIGLVPGDGAHTWRDDDKARRVIVQQGDANDAVFVGFEAVDDDALARAAARLRAAGFEAIDGSDDDARARGVGRLVRSAAPWGVPVEVAVGLAEASTPFASPLVPGGFLTQHVGFGHAVFATTAFDESHRFVVEGLGLEQSDWLEMEIAEGIELEVRFYHCNARHHTIALARAPFELPQHLHHVMFETKDRDDVGAAFDRAWASGLPIPNGLGRHDNDGMFSFYVASPAGFQVEVGHGAKVVGDHWDGNRKLRPHQRVGPPAAAAGMTRDLDADRDADVAIVGCGPVGSALAIFLAQLDRSVTVIERWPEPYPLPRAVHFDHEVGRILQSCGIGDEVRAISEPADIYEWRNAAGTTLLRFGRTGDGPSGWPASSMFNQPRLEALLDRRAVELGVARAPWCRGDRDRPVGVESGRARRRRFDLHGELRRRLRRRQQHGTDQLDLPVTDLGFFYDWLIVDVLLDEPRVFDPINLQICDPARPTTVVSGGPGRRRWEFMRLPHESLDELNDEARAWELARAVGCASGQCPTRTARRVHVQCSLCGAVARRTRADRR